MDADGTLLRAWAREKNEDAFAEIVRRHGELARAAARSVLPAAGDIDADDIAQAVFLALAQKAHEFRPDASVAAWVFTVARRAAIQALKHRRHIQRHLDAARRTVGSTSSASATADLDAVMEKRMASEKLEAALADLKAIYLEPILLHYREGLSRLEAASRLGVTPAALDKRLERGLEKLRRRIARNGVPLGLAALATALWSTARTSESVGGALSVTSLRATCDSLKVSALKTEILHMLWLAKMKTIIGAIGIALAVTLTAGLAVVELLPAGEPPAAPVPAPPRPMPVVAALPDANPEPLQQRTGFLRGVYSLAIPEGWVARFVEQDWVLMIEEKRDAAVALTILMPDPDEDGNGEIEEVDAAEVANQLEPQLREGFAAFPEAVRPTVTRLEKAAWGNLDVEGIRLFGPDPAGEGDGPMEATTMMVASEGGCVFWATIHETDPDAPETRAAMARLRPVIDSFRVDKAKLAEARPLLLEKSGAITRGEPMTVTLTAPDPNVAPVDVF